MPITKSTKKALRQSITRQKRNIKRKGAIKDITKKIKKLLAGNKKEEALGLIPKAYKAIDKAVKRNVLKKNTANRRKSLLARITKK